MQQWRVVGISLRGGKNLSDGITVNMLRLRLVVGNIVLSLRPGGGDALTRGLNEVRRNCIVAKCWKIAFHLQVDQTQ